MNILKVSFLVVIPVIFLFSCNQTKKKETNVSQKNVLRHQVEEIIKSRKATIGVAIGNLQQMDTLLINNDIHFPMQSTYKFPLALAILNEIEDEKLSLDQEIYVKKEQLLPNTHSPLRDKYPNGNTNILLSEIIEYSVSQSDNNACDILFQLAGGTDIVNKYIHRQGVGDINIMSTEAEMATNRDLQFKNSSTPFAMLQLLDKFQNQQILSDSTNQAFLWNTMVNTSTGINRIKGMLPQNTIVAHKTGSGGKRDGITSACNDVGVVSLPNGKQFIIVIFIMNSAETNEVNDGTIAEISKAAYDYFLSK